MGVELGQLVLTRLWASHHYRANVSNLTLPSLKHFMALPQTLQVPQHGFGTWLESFPFLGPMVQMEAYTPMPGTHLSWCPTLVSTPSMTMCLSPAPWVSQPCLTALPGWPLSHLPSTKSLALTEATSCGQLSRTVPKVAITPSPFWAV